jgi:myo-inositol-1(or 4)-monophosphatase
MIHVAIEAAKEAGRFLKYNTGKVKNIEIKKGEERNLVSDLDKASEAKIIEHIRRHYPNHAILAEESGATDTVAEYKWVIDPLDGTTNYLHGVPIYCVTIALEHKGELVAGVIYDPNLDELFTVERGSGAYLNGKKISVSSSSTLIASLLVTGFPYDISVNPDHAIDHFVHFLTKGGGIRRLGSAALDLAYIASGRFDGFWEVNLNPWDMAAGVLLVEEAGGKVTNFLGNPTNIYTKQVLATNGKIHDQMVSVLSQPPS